MANRSKYSKRRNYNLRKVRVASSPAAGALASTAVVTTPITAAAADKVRIVTVEFAYIWADIQAAIDGGLEFGLAHSGYTATQVDECLEANGSIAIGNKIAQEQANRLVRSIGVIAGTDINGGEAVFNDGRRTKTRLNWLLSVGDTLNLWQRNGSGTIWTTGSQVEVQGDMWVKD